MSERKENWFLCGGATHPDAPDDATSLAAAGPRKNVEIDLDGIVESLQANVTPRWRDLLTIAAYVHIADGAVFRGSDTATDNGEAWRRRITMVIAVEEPTFWSRPEVVESLQGALDAVSEDVFAFIFVAGGYTGPAQLKLTPPTRPTFRAWDKVAAIKAFSGGMDSLAGALDRPIGANGPTILVSHSSSTKTQATQRRLVTELKGLPGADRSFVHVSVNVSRRGAAPDKARTHRTRSLLFVALAGTVAHLVGLDEVHMYENGIAAIHLPILPQLIGARATRTAHPKVLKSFAMILTFVADRPVTVTNPFVFLTRADVAQRIQSASASHLLRITVSCAATIQMTTSQPHCGVCSQCIDRQFAVRAARMLDDDPADGYRVHLVHGVREGRDRMMAVGYVAAADKFASYGSPADFVSAHGEVARALSSLAADVGRPETQIVQEVFQLYQRHGLAVQRVMSDLMAAHALDFRRGTLGGASLLPAVIKVAPPSASTAPSTPVRQNQFERAGDYWKVRYRGSKETLHKHEVGLSYLAELVAAPGKWLSVVELHFAVQGETLDVSNVDFGIDSTTVEKWKRRLREMSAQREQARAIGLDVADELSPEGVWISNQLAAVLGPGGKRRSEGADVKRARDRVCRAITRAIASIATHQPALGRHLGKAIHKAFYCSYANDGVEWSL